MTTVVILGTGNVAKHLFNALHKLDSVSVLQMAGRNKELLAGFSGVDTTTDFGNLKEADVYIIAVSDDAIEHLATQISTKHGLVVHTSGSTSLAALNSCKRKGVFYPLQTFSRDSQPDFREIPLCLEAENESDYKLLEQLGSSLSDRLYRINSRERLSLHLAAVFVNNFTNHMYYLGQTICDAQDLPFDLLRPLIRETAEKLSNTSPFEAQTGPARRQDFNTLQAQMEQLTNERLKSIYKILSESIQNTYAAKL